MKKATIRASGTGRSAIARNTYQSLVDKTTGKTGTLVALAPRQAMFRTDPHEEGIFAGWQQPDWTRPAGRW